MRDSTSSKLQAYLGDECMWPFVWDGTMGSKYTVGSAYYRVLAAIRNSYDLVIATPYGFKFSKEGMVVEEEEKLSERPSTEFIDALSLMRARDRIVRGLLRKEYELATVDGQEVAYRVIGDEFEKSADESAKAHTIARDKVPPIAPPTRRTHIATEALAESVRFTSNALTVALKDGRVISAPLSWFPLLEAAAPEQRELYEVVGGGLAIYWPEIGEDVVVASLLAGGEVTQ